MKLLFWHSQWDVSFVRIVLSEHNSCKCVSPSERPGGSQTRPVLPWSVWVYIAIDKEVAGARAGCGWWKMPVYLTRSPVSCCCWKRWGMGVHGHGLYQHASLNCCRYGYWWGIWMRIMEQKRLPLHHTAAMLLGVRSPLWASRDGPW